MVHARRAWSEGRRKYLRPLETKQLATGTQKNSINREHAYLRSVFNELRRLGFWKRDNPLSNLRQFKVADRELSFLTEEQIKALLAEPKAGRNPHAYLIAKVCLSTGARWSEAESLTIRHVKNNQVQFGDTKSGRVRAVPIDDSVQRELHTHHDPKATGDRLFEHAYGAFRDAVDRIGLDLPEGHQPMCFGTPLPATS